MIGLSGWCPSLGGAEVRSPAHIKQALCELTSPWPAVLLKATWDEEDGGKEESTARALEIRQTEYSLPSRSVWQLSEHRTTSQGA